MSAFLFVTPTWNGSEWAATLRQSMPGRSISVWPELCNISDIHYAAAWLPPANVLKDLPSLKVIFSLGAGVDAILSDPTLPRHVPIVRVNDPDMTMRMSEHVLMHVLMHHRQQRRIEENQHAKSWDGFATHAASAVRVGVMGLGVLGQDAASKIAMMGFPTAGWSRTRKIISGVECFAGAVELDAFLGRTDVLVCLLPATADTDGILNHSLFRKLSRKGPFGAPVIINAGRGRQQVEAEILDALDSGVLHGASLDVFRKEPLPQDSRFWTHPKVLLTPHSAADSDLATICNYVARQIARYETDGHLENLVDVTRGY